MEISAKAVMDLRKETGAGPMDCKNALAETGGDVTKAKAWLDARGLRKAEKVTGREAKQGLIETYIHTGRIGSIIELSCETDFVARTEDFKKLAKDIAQQIVGTGAEYISVEDIPAALHEDKKSEYGDGIKKWYEEAVLMNQPYLRDNKVTISDMITQAKAKLGENIVIRRFARYELGK